MDLIEIWADIKGYDVYQVSNTGRVRTLEHFDSLGRRRKQKQRALVPDYAGYVTCKLSHPEKNLKLHRLVANAFIPNPQNKEQVNHKDLDKTNNHASNLEWSTPKENTQHYWKNK